MYYIAAMPPGRGFKLLPGCRKVVAGWSVSVQAYNACRQCGLL